MTNTPPRCPRHKPVCPICRGLGKRYAPGARWRYSKSEELEPCAHCGTEWCAFHGAHRSECACLEPGQLVNGDELCVTCGGSGMYRAPEEVAPS